MQIEAGVLWEMFHVETCTKRRKVWKKLNDFTYWCVGLITLETLREFPIFLTGQISKYLNPIIGNISKLCVY